ncbi:hypothetical protein [Thalassobacillus devorans]|uniref:hypothetical protein n=1 Tax=Thalassobacillus devorans TaxID=279813 RepID=UPI000A1CD923|nr:hypothetical protein [Thalassobacillus devorans]
MKKAAATIKLTEGSVLINAGKRSVSVEVDGRNHELSAGHWTLVGSTFRFGKEKQNVSATHIYCLIEYPGGARMETYPIERPPTGEAILRLIHANPRYSKLNAKARYGDAFPPINQGESTEAITLYVPVDIVIDYYDQRGRLLDYFHYVTESDHTSFLIFGYRRMMLVSIKDK